MQRLLKISTFLVVLLAPVLLSGQLQPADQSLFRIEITQADPQGHPTFAINNLSGKTLIACHIQFFQPSEATPRNEMDWDPIAQGRANDPRLGPLELQSGQSVTLPLPHIVDQPFPDRVEIVAGIWSDGQTFGDSMWTKRLLNHRASLATAYDQSISMLQQGLNENWARDQYLAALNNLPASTEPNALPFSTIRANLQTHQNLDADPPSRQRLIQDLLTAFRRNLALLRSFS